MTDAVLEVADLSKTFAPRHGLRRGAGHPALAGVSFELRERRALGVVGESGSGKTTIARILVGLEKASAGDYTIGGVDPRSLGRGAKARKRRARLVQMVFQDPYSSFDPRQPVAESIRQVLRLHFDLTEAEREHRVATLLEQVGLDERRGQTLPRGLSGGERQRAAIARALAVEPQLVILDEAVSALDVSIQAQILNLLTELRQQTAVSYMLLTHDLAVVRQVADDVIVMRDGRIVERGATDSLFEDPQHPYTQLLLSCVPRQGWKPRRTREARAGVG
ncbi:MAG: ATP-binding cassette domain-containing protein [Solirubrobacteraceae bacterium]